MGLETQTAVEELHQVQDSDGQKVAPANENQQQALIDAVGNQSGATVQTVTTSGTTAEQLPDLSIPDGVTALVVYLPSNAGDVYLGDADNQFVPLTDTGHTFTWDGANTNALYQRTNSAGDGVGIIFEGEQ